MTLEYYRQQPVRRRIADYIGNALTLTSGDPTDGIEKPYRSIDDIDIAAQHGSDLYRSILDRKHSLFAIDLEYANAEFPGEIFHHPKETFPKLEPLRTAVKNALDEFKIAYLEHMTAQGYHLITSITKKSISYQTLLNIGTKLNLLPSATALRLIKESPKQTNSIIRDSIVFAALGLLADYIRHHIKQNTYPPTEPTDIFDQNEIAIFDTTAYGYLITRRTTRCAFSLHSKPTRYPIYDYHGVPLVTLPTKGLTFDKLLEIRSDSTNDYQQAVKLAERSDTHIPSADLTILIDAYANSSLYRSHRKLADELASETFSDNQQTDTLKAIREHCPKLSQKTVFWESLPKPNWDNIRAAALSVDTWRILLQPNPLMLQPANLRLMIRELQNKKFTCPQIIALIVEKYEQNYGWPADLAKNDPTLRAAYWVRTFAAKTQSSSSS